MIIEIDKEVITMTQKVIIMVYMGRKYKVETITDNSNGRVNIYIYMQNRYTKSYEYIIRIEDSVTEDELEKILDIYNSKTIHMYRKDDLRA